MRHGESQNNILAKMSADVYEKYRTFEPELSELGVKESRAVGAAMKAAGINIDIILTSGMKRAILSAKHVGESFPEVPCQLVLAMHEIKGVHMKGKVHPGLSQQEMKELHPLIIIPED